MSDNDLPAPQSATDHTGPAAAVVVGDEIQVRDFTKRLLDQPIRQGVCKIIAKSWMRLIAPVDRPEDTLLWGYRYFQGPAWWPDLATARFTHTDSLLKRERLALLNHILLRLVADADTHSHLYAPRRVTLAMLEKAACDGIGGLSADSWRFYGFYEEGEDPAGSILTAIAQVFAVARAWQRHRKGELLAETTVQFSGPPSDLWSEAATTFTNFADVEGHLRVRWPRELGRNDGLCRAVAQAVNTNCDYRWRVIHGLYRTDKHIVPYLLMKVDLIIQQIALWQDFVRVLKVRAVLSRAAHGLPNELVEMIVHHSLLTELGITVYHDALRCGSLHERLQQMERNQRSLINFMLEDLQGCSAACILKDHFWPSSGLHVDPQLDPGVQDQSASTEGASGARQ